jgi:large subunit ribosomal protein L18
LSGTAERPRLVVFRSLKHIYAHLVDDAQGKVLMGVADRTKGVSPEQGGKVAKGFAVGYTLAQRARESGITRVVFDRAGYAYHGRVRAVAEGARKGGLEF